MRRALAALQKLYESRSGKGLVLLGFPANDFAGQEPRSNDEIADLCKLNHGVRFRCSSRRSSQVTTPDNPGLVQIDSLLGSSYQWTSMS